jgi:SAM-dependent methyltransferase
MDPLNQFNKIAFVYDMIAALVFGKSIKRAQEYFLKDVPDTSIVLILGGGTGWLAKELLKKKPNCRIVYIDASSKMIELARKKTGNSAQINFIHGTEKDIPQIKFDVVITNFFLDMFELGSLSNVTGRIKSSMEKDSIWIATDFIDEGKWWQKMLLKLMYAFFNRVSKIESRALPDWQDAIKVQAMKGVETRSYYAGFIRTVKYSS